MKATLEDPAFVKHAGQFVWLELSIDDPANARFFATHDQHGSLPTFFVIDPKSGDVERAWYGGASVFDMERFLDERKAADAAGEALARGDALMGKGESKQAVQAFRSAIDLGGPKWPRRDHAIEQGLIALLQSEDYAECSAAAMREAPRLPRTHAFVNVAALAIGCKNAAGDAKSEAEERLAREAMKLPAALEDDRYSIYDELIRAHRLRKDAAGAHAIAGEYLASVESQPVGERDRRMARDFARLRAAMALEQPERVIAALEASDRELGDVNSASRLARAYVGARRFEEACATCTRGLLRPAGPGARAGLLRLRAEAERASGDAKAARRDLGEAQRAAQDIPLAPNREGMLAQIKGEIERLH
jgi:hypothetical protein